ncbi:EAL domain-containing protein [Pseudomonas sp. C2B4]|uniref:EAL domain-containing response regulator n=1 Tax=Pseudomonas sp. C2B4 TaxID=2735270 RepID=UPI0015861C17|nr:EAL domain-containing response regulator [Pseudomonas sp. C2B4]
MAYNILVVEDHLFQHQYLLELFDSLGGVSIQSAYNGHEALELLKDQHFDLVLSDLMMPGMDGVQLLQKLGELKQKPALAFMSTASGRMMGSASLAAKSLGFKVLGQIAKPVSLSALRKLLDKLMSFGSELVAAAKVAQSHSFTDLSHAISSGQIQPWFQPKKSLSTGRIVAAEALARWDHPRLGLLLPRDFLPSIICHGLEEALLMQFVTQTIAAQSIWRKQGYDIPVTINLPTHLLDSDDLPDRLHERVVSGGGIPSQIGFELMESSVTENLGRYFSGVCRLRFKGFGLAQDDFGKGYSSYFNLVSTPFTELKIDRSLVYGCVENENLEAALSSIVALGKKLGLNVVAEGVETPDELALLSRLHCDQAQGFLISKAIDPQSFSSMLAEDGPANP